MARVFASASSHSVRFTTVSGKFQNFTYGTFAAVIKKASDGSFMKVLGNANAAGTDDGCWLGFWSSNNIAYANQTGGANDTLPVVAADGWTLIGWTKATGAGGTTHRYKFSTNTWSTGTHGSQADSADFNSDLGVGQGGAPFPDRFNGDIAAVMVLHQRVLSNSEMQRLPAGLWERWATGPGDFLVEFGPSSSEVSGVAGSCRSLDFGRQQSTSVTVGSRSTTDPPGFRYSVKSRRG